MKRIYWIDSATLTIVNQINQSKNIHIFLKTNFISSIQTNIVESTMQYLKDNIIDNVWQTIFINNSYHYKFH